MTTTTQLSNAALKAMQATARPILAKANKGIAPSRAEWQLLAEMSVIGEAGGIWTSEEASKIREMAAKQK